MKLILSVAAVALLAGCSMHGPLSRVAIEHNSLVARTTDEMMLTNILRSRAREPMHFTSLSALHGNVSLSAEADFTAALPSSAIARTQDAKGVITGDTATDAANTLTPGFKGIMSTNPSFDLAVNDSQQFYQGFLRPIEPQTIAHFLDDGWPPQMLTYLLVSRFDFTAENTVYANGHRASAEADGGTDQAAILLAAEAKSNGGILARKGQVVRSLVNNADPADPDFYKFQNFVGCYHLHATRVKKADVALLPLSSLTNLSDIEKLDGKVFDVAASQPGGPLMLVRKGGNQDGLELALSGDDEVRDTSSADICSSTVLAGDEKSLALDARKVHFDFSGGVLSLGEQAAPARLRASYQGLGTYYMRGSDSKRIPIPVGVAATIRSTESLLYFLGEYTRYTTPNRFRVKLGAQEDSSLCDKGTSYDLMVLKTTKPAKSVLSAALHGQTWWVPDNSVECNGRTMEIIALVEQLYNLQKSSTDKVGTQSVRLIQ